MIVGALNLADAGTTHVGNPPKYHLFQGAWSPVSLEFLNDLWIPNVFIYNLKSFHSIEVLKRLAGESISRLL